jgi:WD40 repeat protein
MPTNLTKLIFYFILTLSPLTWASEPSGAPILRIETEMHTDRITQISVDAKERFLLTASEDKTLRLWDLTTGKFIMTYRVPIGAIVEGELHAGMIFPDGEWVTSGELDWR